MNAALDVFSRGRADDLLKIAGEVIGVGEACQCCDLGDAAVAGLHQGYGAADPGLQYISVQWLSNAALEFRTDVVGMEVKMCGQCPVIQRLAVMPVDILNDLLRIKAVRAGRAQFRMAGKIRQDGQENSGHFLPEKGQLLAVFQ